MKLHFELVEAISPTAWKWGYIMLDPG